MACSPRPPDAVLRRALGAVVRTHAVPGEQACRVSPRLRGPARLHALAPAGPQRSPARTRVVVVLLLLLLLVVGWGVVAVAVVAPPGAQPAPGRPVGAPAVRVAWGRVLVPAARSAREAVAEGLRGEVGQGHVAEAQPHALRVEGLDLPGLALQEAADALHALVLQGQHLLLDLGTPCRHYDHLSSPNA